ncbi:hypothetical protein VN97_g12898 [Penicillium thymicola]|uniref:Uncharacterized protein n=1 Tax=Penicillium thymicola TaxID=293382 RepID=A0AAI9T4P2_PENTH|nr:hypothetical protein VN97_g12898 [Penicillium thymicola]
MEPDPPKPLGGDRDDGRDDYDDDDGGEEGSDDNSDNAGDGGGDNGGDGEVTDPTVVDLTAVAIPGPGTIAVPVAAAVVRPADLTAKAAGPIPPPLLP